MIRKKSITICDSTFYAIAKGKYSHVIRPSTKRSRSFNVGDIIALRAYYGEDVATFSICNVHPCGTMIKIELIALQDEDSKTWTTAHNKKGSVQSKKKKYGVHRMRPE